MRPCDRRCGGKATSGLFKPAVAVHNACGALLSGNLAAQVSAAPGLSGRLFMKPGIVYTAVGALIGLLSGCAAPHTPSSAQSVAAYDDIEAQPASALLFETRLPYGGRPVDLARGPRDPSAFVGFRRLG